MVENNEMDLSEQETELYDRQIRLWGLNAQKRLRTARILLCGLNGFGAEIAKNIILSGINHITFLDHRVLTQVDVCSQFLAPSTELGKNRAEASLQRAKHLNPMVEIIADKSDLSEKPDEFFGNFDVVVVTEATTNTLVKIDNACRHLGVKFFAGDVWGMFGYAFTDLQEHTFSHDVATFKTVDPKDKKQKAKMVLTPTQCTVLFPPLQDVLAFDFNTTEYKKKIKRNGPAFVLMKIMHQFRESMGRDPAPSKRIKDIEALLNIRNQIAPGLVPDSAFVHVFGQVAPAAAIVGGELSQEIIKAVSQRESPHNNVFLFDPELSCGFVESIGN